MSPDIASHPQKGQKNHLPRRSSVLRCPGCLPQSLLHWWQMTEVRKGHIAAPMCRLSPQPKGQGPGLPKLHPMIPSCDLLPSCGYGLFLPSTILGNWFLLLVLPALKAPWSNPVLGPFLSPVPAPVCSTHLPLSSLLSRVVTTQAHLPSPAGCSKGQLLCWRCASSSLSVDSLQLPEGWASQEPLTGGWKDIFKDTLCVQKVPSSPAACPGRLLCGALSPQPSGWSQLPVLTPGQHLPLSRSKPERPCHDFRGLWTTCT